ncbi:MAG: HdeA/HdeB family chaperone [Alphaproteobacteria bacterium]|nr:HdeA/HdeB family chaperone [Alphaproteobacteria bacterium]
MKMFVTFAIAAIVCVAFSTPSHAAENAKAASKYDTYTCDELTSLNYEYVGSIVYYVKGHYDAKRDIWTAYGPKSKSETADIMDDYIPVQDVYAYCVKNPKDTVINAITKHKK